MRETRETALLHVACSAKFALFLNDLDTFFTKLKWDTLYYIDKLYSDCNNNVSRMLNLFVLIMQMTLL